MFQWIVQCGATSYLILLLTPAVFLAVVALSSKVRSLGLLKTMGISLLLSTVPTLVALRGSSLMEQESERKGALADPNTQDWLRQRFQEESAYCMSVSYGLSTVLAVVSVIVVLLAVWFFQRRRSV